MSPETPPLDRETPACVACGGDDLENLFTKIVLDRHEARYSRCRRCRSLQVSRVGWLAEAYSDAIRQLDTGAAQRCILCGLYIRAMRQCGLLRRGQKVLDFGSGSGLLIRLLRDQVFDAFGYDTYVTSQLVPEFTLRELSRSTHFGADAVTAFEVFEHLVDPREALATIAANLAPDGIVLFRTELYQADKHGPDWEYLYTAHGQHINFFSAQGLTELGRPLGLTPVFLPFGFHLYVRQGRSVGAFRRLMLFKLAAMNFVLARMIGLCRFDQARSDARQLTQR